MSSDRGQLILIGAVLVAVAILGSVVLLNVLHVPADINSQQDARSLDAVERTTQQVSDDLERLFLVHTSVSERSQRVPYANKTGGGQDPRFADVVGNYGAVNADLTASAGSRLVTVKYLAAGSETGTFIRHNGTGKNLTVDGSTFELLDGADTMPYVYLNVTGHNKSGLGIEDGNQFTVEIDSKTITFGETAVSTPNGSISGTHGDLYPMEVEIVDGVGEVRTGDGVQSFTVPAGPNVDVIFTGGNTTMGSYAVSGTGVDSTDLVTLREYQYMEDNVIVNPKFQMNVTDASVTHSRKFDLYNGTRP